MSDFLYLHGIGHEEQFTDWRQSQQQLVQDALGPFGVVPEVASLAYDDLFEVAEFGPRVVFEGGARLLASLAENGLDDLLGISRDRGGWSPTFRWFVGMVAQWVALPGLREELKLKLREAIEENDPKVIIGHSLGSLICYDTFSDLQYRDLLKGRILLTFGSQIGHPAVRSVYGGRITALAGTWVNLFNRQDRAFVKSLHPAGEGDFAQLATEFDSPTPFNHEAEYYLGHRTTLDTFWPAIAESLKSGSQKEGATVPSTRSITASTGINAGSHPGSQLFLPVRDSLRTSRQPRTRAVLVGIDNYKSGIANLKGCVNDQFQLSAVLQETGFRPESIRALFNESATAQAITDRLRWLFDEAMPGDSLVFAYSGHGAQLTPRKIDGTPDAHMECLLPYDCDWTPNTLIADVDLVQLYADLPYGVNLILILDCCHSGGVWRNVGAQVRGVPPPDDLRHEGLQWDKEEQMWIPRNPKQIDPKNAKFGRSAKLKACMVGEDGNIYRLGRAYSARAARSEFVKIRDEKGHEGPFTPVVFQACKADQLASEYLHGSITYGVFTYAFTHTLKQLLDQRQPATIESLVNRVRTQLKRLNYAQDPEVSGPGALLSQQVADFFQFSQTNSR